MGIAMMIGFNDYKEILQMRREFAVLRAEWKRVLHGYYAHKFDPNQPRVPAGNPDGGQWTSEGGDAAYLNVAGPQSATYCWNQMLIDMIYCGSFEQPWYRAACRAQANERYAACLAGRPIPPLPF